MSDWFKKDGRLYKEMPEESKLFWRKYDSNNRVKLVTKELGQRTTKIVTALGLRPFDLSYLHPDSLEVLDWKEVPPPNNPPNIYITSNESIDRLNRTQAHITYLQNKINKHIDKKKKKYAYDSVAKSPRNGGATPPQHSETPQHPQHLKQE